MSKRINITYPSSLRDWHLHIPMRAHDRGDNRYISSMGTVDIVKTQNRLYRVLESWRILLERHFGLSCRWSGVTFEQTVFSDSHSSQPQVIYLIKNGSLSFSWSFDDRFIRHLLGFSFGLSAEESDQLGSSEMEQLFFKQVFADTLLPILNELGVNSLDPQPQQGRREVNALIADQDTYYQFHFDMKIPSLKETVSTTLSFTETTLSGFMALPNHALFARSKVALSEDVLCQIFSPVEARLGHVDLSLGELKELQVGDVLVLNKGLADSVELRIAGELGFKGTLGLINRRMSVQLLSHDNNQKMGDDLPNIPDNDENWFESHEEPSSEIEMDSAQDDSANESEDEFDWEKL